MRGPSRTHDSIAMSSISSSRPFLFRCRRSLPDRRSRSPFGRSIDPEECEAEEEEEEVRLRSFRPLSSRRPRPRDPRLPSLSFGRPWRLKEHERMMSSQKRTSNGAYSPQLGLHRDLRAKGGPTAPLRRALLVRVGSGLPVSPVSLFRSLPPLPSRSHALRRHLGVLPPVVSVAHEVGVLRHRHRGQNAGRRRTLSAPERRALSAVLCWAKGTLRQALTPRSNNREGLPSLNIS